jgi:hypothetical protein
MTDLSQEDMDRTQQERERETDALLGDEQGEDDSEREGALPEGA